MPATAPHIGEGWLFDYFFAMNTEVIMDNFDKDFKRLNCLFVIILALTIGLVGFAVWAIVMLMQYFNII